MKYIKFFLFLFKSEMTRLYFSSKGFTIAKGARFEGFPIFYKVSNASVTIGANTLINSDNSRYHLNMHSRSKLLADRENAIITIGANCRIHGTCIHAYNSISIGDNCLIAANTQIFDGNGHALSFPDVENRIKTTDHGNPIIIEDNVWIGCNAIILGGTRIGRGTIIAAGSVVRGKIPPMSMCGGNPAKDFKTYSTL